MCWNSTLISFVVFRLPRGYRRTCTKVTPVDLWFASVLYNVPSGKYRGGTMGNLTSALQQLREERKQAQSRVENLDQAISVIESLNGSGTVRQTNQPGRIISAASRRKMAQAQRARWARAKKASRPIALAKTTGSAPVKRTMSAAARRKIAAFQRARWAKLKAGKKAA
jgi:hypothetical protein